MGTKQRGGGGCIIFPLIRENKVIIYFFKVTNSVFLRQFKLKKIAFLGERDQRGGGGGGGKRQTGPKKNEVEVSLLLMKIQFKKCFSQSLKISLLQLGNKIQTTRAPFPKRKIGKKKKELKKRKFSQHILLIKTVHMIWFLSLI